MLGAQISHSSSEQGDVFQDGTQAQLEDNRRVLSKENETILFGGMLKQSHIQFVTNTIVCSLVLNNYSIYKFSKALVPQKNTNECPFETDKTPSILPSFLQKLWHWFSRLVLQEESQSLTQIISDATSLISTMWPSFLRKYHYKTIQV